jgi:hypothetical protein
MAVIPLALAGALVLAAGPASAAESCPNAKYRTGPSLFLPECRVYEMVTPKGKTNVLKPLVPVSDTANMAKVATDGEGILYLTASGPLSEVAAAGMPTWERAHRGDRGWTSESATPPIVAPFGETGLSDPKWVVPSSNLGKIFFTASAVFSPDQTFGGLASKNGSVHLSDGITDTWVSRPTWAGAAPTQGSDAGWAMFVPLGGSPDLSTVYFNSLATLTPEDGTSGRTVLQSWAVYKYENGQLSNAGVLPDGSLSPGGSVSADRAGQNSSFPPAAGDIDATLHHPVSSDGKSLLFLSPDPVRTAVDPLLPKPQLYMAVDGKPSILISAPEGDDEPVAGTTGVVPTSDRMQGIAGVISSAYAVATPDHSVVLFSTKDALTDAAEGVDPEIVKTYRYEAAADALTYLPDLDRAIISGAGGNEKYGQIVELSESGNSMLYRTDGGLLKLWRNGKPTLTISEGVSGVISRTATYITHARFSDDGNVLVLNATGPLRGEPNHTPGTSAVVRSQVYRYAVNDDHLECISCKPGGSLTGAALSGWGPENGYTKAAGSTPTGNWSTRSMTADGSTIYFTTATPLIEADHNTANDVYQWHDGQLKLISSGASGADNALLYETTKDGSDVFILSAERLSPADTDDMYDIYDVRVNGGFDPPEGAGGGCALGECQGPPPAAPASPAMGSTGLTGLGNRSAAENPRRRAQPLGVSGAKSVTGTSAVLRVRVQSAGRIVIEGQLVKKAARRVSKAGQYRVRVSLTGPGKLVLARKYSLKTGLRVSFKSGSATTTRNTRVTFRKPGAKTSPSASRKGR